MYKVTDESKKTVNKIVENMNNVGKGKKGYLESGKSTVDIKMPSLDSKVGEKLGEYAEETAKKIKKTTKKVKANINVE